MIVTMRWLSAIVVTVAAMVSAVHADQRFITLAATTTTDNAGFFDYVLPLSPGL